MLWVLKYKAWNQASHQPRLRVYTEWGNCPKHTYPNLTKEGENLEWFYFKFSHTHTKGPGVPGSIREFFQIFNGKIIRCLSSAVPSRGQKEKLCTSLKFFPVFGQGPQRVFRLAFNSRLSSCLSLKGWGPRVHHRAQIYFMELI